MTAKAIRVFTQRWSAQEYHDAVELGDSPTPSDEEGEAFLITDWAESFSDQIPAGDVQVAAGLLTGHYSDFWAVSCSADRGPATTTSWYSDHQYVHPHTGQVTEKTAYLEGDWTDQEAEQIRALVLATPSAASRNR